MQAINTAFDFTPVTDKGELIDFLSRRLTKEVTALFPTTGWMHTSTDSFMSRLTIKVTAFYSNRKENGLLKCLVFMIVGCIPKSLEV